MTRIRVWALSIDTRELYVSAKTGTLDRLIHALKHNPCFLGIRPKKEKTWFLFRSKLAREHMRKEARAQGYDAQYVFKDNLTAWKK